MGECILHGNGGGSSLNFRIIGGTSMPASPKGNDIWVNTDTEITGWQFGTDEPNVRNVQTISANDPHCIVWPHKLSEGDIINFTIPATVTGTYEALRILDGSRIFYVRGATGVASAAWPAGTKIGLRIVDDSYPIGEWGTVNDGSALIFAWDKYYHESGTVWIQTDNSSSVPFNAVKKNGVTVYPLKASQYINGAWVEKIAKSYQGGAWADWWNGQLYENGNEYESITGGYSTYGSGATLTKNQDHLYIKSQGNSGVYTNNPVDMTDYNTLTFDWTCVRGGIDTQFQVRSNKSTGTSGWAAGTKIIGPDTKRQTVSLDISGLSGSYYIGIGRFSSGGPNESNIHSIIMS